MKAFENYLEGKIIAYKKVLEDIGDLESRGETVPESLKMYIGAYITANEDLMGRKVNGDAAP